MENVEGLDRERRTDSPKDAKGETCQEKELLGDLRATYGQSAWFPPNSVMNIELEENDIQDKWPGADIGSP